MNITTILQMIDYDMEKIIIDRMDRYPNITRLVSFREEYKVFFIENKNIYGIFDIHTSEVIFIQVGYYIWYSECWAKDTEFPRVSEKEILDQMYTLVGKEPLSYITIDGISEDRLGVLDGHAAELDLSRNSYLVKILLESAYNKLKEAK